jgi:hypothetical protein
MASYRRAKKKQRSAGPSKASLREIPEIDFATAKVRPNPHAARIAREGIEIQVGRGRPRKLREIGETEPRSVRFPPSVWKTLEKAARKKGLTLHAALRGAILDWLHGEQLALSRSAGAADRVRRAPR